MDKKYKIYFLRHPETLEIRYIGQTSQKPSVRLLQHLNYDNKVSKKASWITSLKNKGIKPIMEIINSFDSVEECDLEETKLIKEYKENGFRLLNDAPGGKSNAGCKRSQETCRKISEMKKGCKGWNKGMKMPKEFGEAISKRKIGIPSPRKGVFGIVKQKEETKLKHSKNNTGNGNPFYGKKHTAETRKKLSDIGKSEDKIKTSLENLKKITPEDIKRGAENRKGWKQKEDVKKRISESVKRTKALIKLNKQKGQLNLF